MSTELGKIEGKTEVFDPIFGEHSYEDSKLYMTSFSGTERGMCLQLTVDHPHGFIQLTSKEVDDLISKLKKWKTS